jgi:D-inositol-3-phosphate glycosyltransferase
MNPRIATLMVHTSPLDQPGIGDAGGMNIYVVESAERMAAMGVSVDIFTRRQDPKLPDIVEISPGVRVRHLNVGHLKQAFLIFPLTQSFVKDVCSLAKCS